MFLRPFIYNDIIPPTLYIFRRQWTSRKQNAKQTTFKAFPTYISKFKPQI